MLSLDRRSALGWSFGLVGALALAAGCSGTNAVHYTNPVPASPPPLTSVAVSVALPIGGSGPLRAHLRGLRSLSTSNVQSLSVQAALGGTQAQPAVINTTQGSANCTVAGATLNCTGSVQAPVGSNVTFAIVSFGQTNAQGSPLAGGTLLQNVASSGTTLAITPAVLAGFNFFIASLSVSVDKSVFPAGTPGQFTFSFAAVDASGQPIDPPSVFANPILLLNPGTNVFGYIPAPGATPDYQSELVPPVTAAGQSLSFGYSGLAPGFNPGDNVFTFPISVAGLNPNQISGSTNITIVLPTPSAGPTLLTPTPVPPTPTPGATTTPSPLPTFTAGPITLNPTALYFAEPTAAPQTFTASEPGVSTFHAVPLDPTVASVSPSNGTNFTVTPLSAGLTLIIVTDASGNANGEAVYVNQIIINPQAKTRLR
jgi:hypothetical protein